MINIIKRRHSTSWQPYLITFLICALLGFLSEVMQISGSRDADFWDIVRDIVGIIFFLGISFSYGKNNAITGLKNGRTYRAMIFAGVTLILILGLIPLITTGVAYLHRNHAFPVIAKFDNLWELTFMRFSNLTLEIENLPIENISDPINKAGKMTFYPADFSEFKIIEPIPDWQAYKQLAIEFYSTLATQLELHIKIEDKSHNGDFNDRFNQRFFIDSGYNKIAIPIVQIEKGPEFRLIDLEKINSIALFTIGTQERFSIFINSIYLE